MISHLKPACSLRGGLFFRATVMICIAASRVCGFAGVQEHTSWRDPATGLTWTVADNGSGVSWHQAMRYCGDLRTASYSDWTLPGVEDLQGLFGGPENESGRHVRGPLKITGWEWSSTPGQQQGEGWVFDFGDGGRASVAAGDSGLNRALCVRGHTRR